MLLFPTTRVSWVLKNFIIDSSIIFWCRNALFFTCWIIVRQYSNSVSNYIRLILAVSFMARFVIHPDCTTLKMEIWTIWYCMHQSSHRDWKTWKMKKGHGKIMEHEKLAQSHGNLWSVMEFWQFCPRIVPNLYFVVTTKKLSSNLDNLQFPTFFAKRRKCKAGKRDGHGKSRNGHGKVMENILLSLWEPCGQVLIESKGRDKSWPALLLITTNSWEFNLCVTIHDCLHSHY